MGSHHLQPPLKWVLYWNGFLLAILVKQVELYRDRGRASLMKDLTPQINLAQYNELLVPGHNLSLAKDWCFAPRIVPLCTVQLSDQAHSETQRPCSVCRFLSQYSQTVLESCVYCLSDSFSCFPFKRYSSCWDVSMWTHHQPSSLVAIKFPLFLPYKKLEKIYSGNKNSW